MNPAKSRRAGSWDSNGWMKLENLNWMLKSDKFCKIWKGWQLWDSNGCPDNVQHHQPNRHPYPPSPAISALRRQGGNNETMMTMKRCIAVHIPRWEKIWDRTRAGCTWIGWVSLSVWTWMPCWLRDWAMLASSARITTAHTQTHTHTHTHKRLNSLALFNFKNFQGKHLTVDFISFLFFTMQKHLTSPPSPNLIFWHLPKCFKSCQYSTLALNVNSQFYWCPA